MPKSVLEAIQEGDWEFEPERVEETRFNSTHAKPGTREKLSIMAARVEAGLPIWHASDKIDYEDEEE